MTQRPRTVLDSPDPPPSHDTPLIIDQVFLDRGEQRYALELRPAGIKFEVDRLRREHRELHGELSVRVNGSTPKAKTIRDGLISIGDLNFSSVQARGTRAKLLAARSGANALDWEGFLESFVLQVIEAERTGKPAVVLADVPHSDDDTETWDIESLPILQTLPMVIFGDGDSLKSYLSMWVAGSLANQGIPVLYCDWEFAVRPHRDRLERLFQPMPKNVFYVRCDKPLKDEIERLQRLIREHGCRYIICDSIMFALDGKADEEQAGIYFRSVRQLGDIGSLHVAHTQKTEGETDKTVYGCHDAETEVLTKRGWVQHEALNSTDPVACFDKDTETIDWEIPTAFHRYRFDGELIRIKGASVDMRVTPGHRLLVKKPTSKGNRKGYTDHWRFMEAERLNTTEVRIPFSAPFKEHAAGWTCPDDFLRLVGWWIAEGSVTPRGEAVLTQNDGPLAKQMRDTATALGFQIKVWISKGGRRRTPSGAPEKPCMQLRIKSRQLGAWLVAECGKGAYNKRLPRRAFDLSLRQRTILLKAMMDGDGHRHHKGTRGEYSTSSRQLANEVQRLVFMNGLTARVREEHEHRFVVLIGVRRETMIVMEHGHVRREPYNGDVFCLTVPTGAYVTRRNGYISITGNSVFFGNGARSIWMVHKAKESPRGEKHIGLFHRKANTGEQYKPLGFKFVFRGDRTAVERMNVEDSDELAAMMPLFDRAKKALQARGSMAPKALADELGVTVPILLKMKSRHASVFSFFGSKIGLVAGGVTEGVDF